MFSTKIRALVQQQWAGLIALFLVLTGGVAWASHPGGANTINSADIIDGQVRTADVGSGEVRTADIGDGQVKAADVGEGAVNTSELANGEVKAADIGQAAVGADELAANAVGAGEIADGQVNAAEIATGAVRTAEIANGQVEAEDLAPGVAPGASGARAWGLVHTGGSLLRQKNVTAVTNPGNGVYCIDPGSGIDPTTAVMVVGGDMASGVTSETFNDVSHAEWDSTPLDCPAGTMEVRTFVGLADRPSGGELDEGGFSLRANALSFTFVIP